MDKDKEKRSRWRWRLSILGALFGLAPVGLLWTLAEPGQVSPLAWLEWLVASVFFFFFMGGLLGTIMDAARKR